jgi:phosphatidylglycerophosphate synthase
MGNVPFGGDQKKGVWVLANAERRMVIWMVPRVPSWLETYHLTMLTLAWCVGIVLASLMAPQNSHWLWLVSAFIALQYLTDVLDGAVGRYRNTGLIKWGFYMDHLLDYLFLASIIAGYSLALPDLPGYWFMAFLAVGGAFMVNMFLSFAATNEFKISAMGIGPTEIRIFFIMVNAGIIFFGSAWLPVALPILAVILPAFLAWMVFRTHKHLWNLDMEHKRAAEQAAGPNGLVS